MNQNFAEDNASDDDSYSLRLLPMNQDFDWAELSVTWASMVETGKEDLTGLGDEIAQGTFRDLIPPGHTNSIKGHIKMCIDIDGDELGNINESNGVVFMGKRSEQRTERFFLASEWTGTSFNVCSTCQATNSTYHPHWVVSTSSASGATSATTEASAPSGSSWSSNHIPLIAGIAAGVGALLLVAVFMIFRRRQSYEDDYSSSADEVTEEPPKDFFDHVGAIMGVSTSDDSGETDNETAVVRSDEQTVDYYYDDYTYDGTTATGIEVQSRY